MSWSVQMLHTNHDAVNQETVAGYQRQWHCALPDWTHGPQNRLSLLRSFIKSDPRRRYIRHKLRETCGLRCRRLSDDHPDGFPDCSRQNLCFLSSQWNELYLSKDLSIALGRESYVKHWSLRPWYAWLWFSIALQVIAQKSIIHLSPNWFQE